MNRSSFFAQTIVLASAKLIAIDLSYILYSFISIFLWNLKNLDLFILGWFYTQNGQEKHRCFWTVEDSLLVYFFLHLLLVTTWILLYSIFSFHFLNTYLLFIWLYLNPQLWPWTKVCLFFKDFVGIGLVIFSATQHGVRGLCRVMCDRAVFSRKKTNFSTKTANMSQIKAKNKVFWIYWEI